MKESSLLDRALAGMMIAGLTTVLWMDRGLRGLVILLAVIMGVFCVVGFWRDGRRTQIRGLEELRSMHDNQRREIAALRKELAAQAKQVAELEAEAALHRDRHRGSGYRRSGRADADERAAPSSAEEQHLRAVEIDERAQRILDAQHHMAAAMRHLKQ